MMTEEYAAKEYFHLVVELKRLERRKEVLAEVLKARTGERLAGTFLVNVSSYTTERIDSEAVKAILGDATPMKSSASVRLTVALA